MGAVFNGSCFTSQADAADAYFASTAPALTSGSTSYMTFFEKSGGTWLLVRKSIESNGSVLTLSSVAAPVPTFPACDPMERFIDGQSVGWLLAGLLVLAWGLTLVRRQVQ